MDFAGIQKEAESADGESARVDFKRSFCASANADWCELVKDIVAMTNSGGGAIIVGLDDDGKPVGLDGAGLEPVDPADITNKIFKYTGKHFAEFRSLKIDRGGLLFDCMLIGAAATPLVFTSPGSYEPAGGKSKMAFAVGTVYFRHGAKSEPGTSDDLDAFLKRELASFRTLWIDRLRQVVEAPYDASVVIVPAGGVRLDESSTQTIRITEDPSAPIHRLADPNLTHPFRQKEVLAAVNAKLVGWRVGSHDVLTARRVHGIDQNPIYCYHGTFASPTYSQAFVDWLLKQHADDPEFFVKCRREYKPANGR